MGPLGAHILLGTVRIGTRLDIFLLEVSLVVDQRSHVLSLLFLMLLQGTTLLRKFVYSSSLIDSCKHMNVVYLYRL
jgi:hypothetical protein